MSFPNLRGLSLAFLLVLTATLGARAQDPQPKPGLQARFYDLGGIMINQMPVIAKGEVANLAPVLPNVVLADWNKTNAWMPFAQSYLLTLRGRLLVPQTGEYVLRLRSAGGSILRLNGREVVNHDGNHKVSQKDARITLRAGTYDLELDQFHAGVGYRELTLWWKQPGAAEFVYIPAEHFQHVPTNVVPTAPGHKKIMEGSVALQAGDESPVAGIHPSYTLGTIRPSRFRPRVGGMDFLPDGRLALCTWDSLGAVYLLKGVETGDTSKVTFKRIAMGLSEPLGLKVVNGQIYVLQKHELTRLVDTDGDDVIDEYQTVCNAWGAQGNFHEFAFGLVWKDTSFYAALSIAINPGGRSTIPQNRDRGKAVRIRLDGSIEYVARGLRTPNGIGLGPDGEIFITDNQGDWLPSSKVLHLKKDAFYNNYAVDLYQIGRWDVTPPVAWLPQDEIGNSPSQPLLLKDGPYRGQMVHGEVTYGGLQRVFIEKVNGEYQGAAFKFMQGFEAGVNRLCYGPDSAIYAGGVGSRGNWGHYGHLWYGLQKVKYNGQPTFEPLSLSARANGFQLTFTEPVKPGALTAAGLRVETWRYLPTMQYGGPKTDKDSVKIQSITPMGKDGRTFFVELAGLKAGNLYYFHLNRERVKAASGRQLWITEGWYTLNQIPAAKGPAPQRKPTPAPIAVAVKPRPKPAPLKAPAKVEDPRVVLAQGSALIERSGCRSCHSFTDKVLGPSYQAVAQRYGSDPNTIKKLTDKVYNGGSGAWGDYAMGAQSHLPKEEISKMVRYILSLDGGK